MAFSLPPRSLAIKKYGKNVKALIHSSLACSSEEKLGLDYLWLSNMNRFMNCPFLASISILVSSQNWLALPDYSSVRFVHFSGVRFMVPIPFSSQFTHNQLRMIIHIFQCLTIRCAQAARYCLESPIEIHDSGDLLAILIHFSLSGSSSQYHDLALRSIPFLSWWLRWTMAQNIVFLLTTTTHVAPNHKIKQTTCVYIHQWQLLLRFSCNSGTWKFATPFSFAVLLTLSQLI